VSSVRGRRGTSSSRQPGRRTGARTVARAGGPQLTGPVRSGVRSTAPRRPGQRRSVRRPTRATGSRRRPLFTGRAVLLGALVLLLALTLAGPVRQFLAGRAQLVQLAAEGSELDRRTAELKAQLARQADPEWTARQARQRLTYVLPGDRLVVVQDGEAVEGAAGTPSAGTPGFPALPWYQGLLRSVAVADGDRPGAAEGSRPGG
jgi:cell division protein FtsB